MYLTCPDQRDHNTTSPDPSTVVTALKASCLTTAFTVTRTVKNNDRNHAGLADGTAVPEDRLPRYFAKSGHVDADPKAIKKSGGGKGNWGTLEDEKQDYGYKFANERRRSNSSTQTLNDFKTKFEAVDQEPVFEEDLHGPSHDDIEQASTLSKEESIDSIDEEDGFKNL